MFESTDKPVVKLLKLIVGLFGVWYASTVLRQTDTLNGDSLKQMVAAISLSDGKGFSYPEGERKNLSISSRRTIVAWPPAYSHTLGFLTNIQGNIRWARSTTETLSAILFYSSWVAIFFYLRPLISSRHSFFLLLFWLFLTPPLTNRLSTDGIGLAFLSCGIATSMAGVKSARWPLFWGVIAGLFSTTTMAIRYSYYPIPLAIGLAFLCQPKGKKKWTLLLGYVVSAAYVLLLIKSDFNNILRDNSTGIGKVHWHQVANFSPFMHEFLGLQKGFPKVLSFLGGSLFHKMVIYWLVFLFTLAIAFWGLKRFKCQLKTLAQEEQPPLYFFYCASVLISIFITIELTVLAAFVPLEASTYKGYSTLGVPRYFGPVALFVFVYATHAITEVKRLHSSKLRSGISVILFLTLGLVGCNAVVWNLFHHLKMQVCGYYAPTLEYYQGHQNFDELFQLLRKRASKQEPFFYTDEDPVRGSFLSLSGAYCLPTTEFNTFRSLPVIVIESIKDESKLSCKPFLKFGDSPQKATSLKDFIEVVKGKEIQSSLHWKVYEGEIPRDRWIKLTEKVACNLTPLLRNQ